MGSDSDFPIMKGAIDALNEFGVSHHRQVLSAHRTPEDMLQFAKDAQDRGIRILIAGAGGAAHLPGMLASMCDIPVIGVPIPHGPMQGQDALYSIVQMPKGVPVATVAIGNAYNAGLLAVKCLAFGTNDPDLMKSLHAYRLKLAQESRSKTLP